MDDLLLDVRDLRVGFTTLSGKTVTAVHGVSFTVRWGETMGLVGESGSGKSVTAMSLLRLLPSPPARLLGGSAVFEGEDLLSMPMERLRQIRGGRIGMIFQDPMTALNPVMRVGKQVAEVLKVHGKPPGAVRWLEAVKIPNAAARAMDYPHQFSGGMRQRVVIAQGVACEPPLVLADEPTTALDVTIQAQIMALLEDQRRSGTSIILITHNLGLVARFCHRTVVMYGGEVVESGPTRELFRRPHHPYTRGLLASVPRIKGQDKLEGIPGTPPAPGQEVSGCRFHPRCPVAEEACKVGTMVLREVGDGHQSRCRLNA